MAPSSACWMRLIAESDERPDRTRATETPPPAIADWCDISSFRRKPGFLQRTSSPLRSKKPDWQGGMVSRCQEAVNETGSARSEDFRISQMIYETAVAGISPAAPDECQRGNGATSRQCRDNERSRNGTDETLAHVPDLAFPPSWNDSLLKTLDETRRSV